ncbi:hypothetical protein AGR7A_Lc120114 [Agrobacterium deltaense NCPPB 1641]|uniref:Uncharacterized protein n=1 Tax=Agrobacterium deltaense NCPPB 1641 TaxID=1183425 RepID=A0A1S7TVB4_9HYPH|nr:hypothetical protein AGR7A_Lc120114 [Agrobacterium deltaense NCPPB 1641]
MDRSKLAAAYDECRSSSANRFVSDMAESAIAELASFIEQVGLVHEQEEFDPKSPLATSRQVRP